MKQTYECPAPHTGGPAPRKRPQKLPLGDIPSSKPDLEKIHLCQRPFL